MYRLTWFPWERDLYQNKIKIHDMEKEIRSLDPVNAEVRASRRGRRIEGYAIVFNKESRDLGGFTERIEPGAVEGVLEKSDILALLNHDEGRGLLARSTNGEGTLELSVDNFGVRYAYDAPDTVLGDEVLSGVRRGDIKTSSFAFKIADNGDKWEKRDDGYLRIVKKFDKIFDVSCVYREAYEDTTVAVRSLVEVRTAEAEKTAAEAQKRIADLEEELRAKEATPPESTDAPKADPVAEKPKEPEPQKPSFAELEAYYKELESKM